MPNTQPVRVAGPTLAVLIVSIVLNLSLFWDAPSYNRYNCHVPIFRDQR